MYHFLKNLSNSYDEMIYSVESMIEQAHETMENLDNERAPFEHINDDLTLTLINECSDALEVFVDVMDNVYALLSPYEGDLSVANYKVEYLEERIARIKEGR